MTSESEDKEIAMGGLLLGYLESVALQRRLVLPTLPPGGTFGNVW